MTFGATDKPLTAAELTKAGLVQWPMVMGGIVPVVNIDGIKPGQMTFDGETLAKIFLGEIKTWNDPAIAKLNPGVTLPSAAISVVHRSDGSGTTFNFTDYLSKVSAEWKSKVGEETAVEWPVGIGAKGNEGVSNNVQQTKNSIGYVESAYAKQNKLTYAGMINSAGKKVEPLPPAFQAAAANADWAKAPGFYLILTNQPGDASWPITASTFILMPRRAERSGRGDGCAQILFLVLQQGGRGRDGARLYPDAGQCRDLGRAGVESRDQEQRRQAVAVLTEPARPGRRHTSAVSHRNGTAVPMRQAQ